MFEGHICCEEKSGKGVGMGRGEDVNFKQYHEGRSHSKDDDV